MELSLNPKKSNERKANTVYEVATDIEQNLEKLVRYYYLRNKLYFTNVIQLLILPFFFIVYLLALI